METKLFQIRDDGTHIPALCVATFVDLKPEHNELRRAGFRTGDWVVWLTKLNTCETQYDPHAWHSQRTMPIAHRFIEKHWAELVGGQVIDVEFINGERDSPREPE